MGPLDKYMLVHPSQVTALEELLMNTQSMNMTASTTPDLQFDWTERMDPVVRLLPVPDDELLEKLPLIRGLYVVPNADPMGPKYVTMHTWQEVGDECKRCGIMVSLPDIGMALNCPVTSEEAWVYEKWREFQAACIKARQQYHPEYQYSRWVDGSSNTDYWVCDNKLQSAATYIGPTYYDTNSGSGTTSITQAPAVSGAQPFSRNAFKGFGEHDWKQFFSGRGYGG